MKNAIDFIRFALSHAKAETIPFGAKLPLDPDECGTSPWEFLPGTAGDRVTEEMLETVFNKYYANKGWTREHFDHLTDNFVRTRAVAASSQGLLTAYTGMEATPNYCYSAWCTEKGELDAVKRPFALGEAVFFKDEDGRAVHTGFICGSMDGEPLVVEARGLAAGVSVSRLSERPWTHRGLCTRQLIYDEDCYDEQIVLYVRKPMIQGEAIRRLQQALNALGYYCGRADGKCGEQTMRGVREFVDTHCARKRAM